MKIYLLSFFMGLIFLTGCTSIDKTEIIEFKLQLEDYMNVNGNKFIEYVQNDKNLTRREKEIYFARHRSMLQYLNSIKELEKEQ